MARITQGEWEAVDSIVSITPEGHTEAMIVYDPKMLGCPWRSGAMIEDMTVAELRTQLKANARAIAALPEILMLLEELADTGGKLGTNELGTRAEELLKMIE